MLRPVAAGILRSHSADRSERSSSLRGHLVAMGEGRHSTGVGEALFSRDRLESWRHQGVPGFPPRRK